MASPLRTERIDAAAGILGIGDKKAEHIGGALTALVNADRTG